MSEYHYLTASLPMLMPESAPPFSSQAFGELCSRQMNSRDFNLLQQAGLNAPAFRGPSCALLEKWRENEYGLRNELAKLRAKKLNTDPEPHLRRDFNNPLLASRAKEIFEAENPLKAEILFNACLWEILNEMEAGQMFNLNFLLIYSLKLQLLERRRLFDQHAGREKLESIIDGETSNG